MTESTATPKAGFWPRLRAFIKERRKRLPGFGLLIFYCHMLMLFAYGLRMHLGELTDLDLLRQLSGALVPVLFTATTFGLFWRPSFHIAIALGLIQALMGVFYFIRLPLSGAFPFISALPWLAALLGLILLLLFSARKSFRKN